MSTQVNGVHDRSRNLMAGRGTGNLSGIAQEDWSRRQNADVHPDGVWELAVNQLTSPILLPLFAGIALLVIGALSYGAAGYAAARAAAFFARLGRNRSTTLVAIAAVVSALPIPMGNWWPTQEAPTRPAAVLAELGAEAIAKDAHHLAAAGPRQP